MIHLLLFFLLLNGLNWYLNYENCLHCKNSIKETTFILNNVKSMQSFTKTTIKNKFLCSWQLPKHISLSVLWIVGQKKKTTDILILKIGIDKNENGHFFIRLTYDLTDNWRSFVTVTFFPQLVQTKFALLLAFPIGYFSFNSDFPTFFKVKIVTEIKIRLINSR